MLLLKNCVILLTATLVMSEEICYWVESGEGDQIQKLDCTDNKGLNISLSIINNNTLSVKCSTNETDTHFLNLFPVLNQSLIAGIYRLILEDCPLPDHYAMLSSIFPSISVLEFFVWNLYNHEIKPDFFAAGTNLTNLGLSNYDIETLHCDVFVNLKLLMEIDLSDNKFKEFPSNLFEQNHNLNKFILESNKNALNLVGGLLANKISLSSVRLRFSEVKFLSTTIFSNSTNIIEIDLSQTKLRTIDR